MEHTVFIAIVAGLGGMLGWGFSEFATKKSVDDIGTISSLVWAHVFGTIILFGILIPTFLIDHTHVLIPMTLSEWAGFIFFGTLQTIVYYFAYKAFERGKVSILAPIFASFAGMVALLSVLVFGEVLNVGFVPGLALTFGGVILMNLNFESVRGIRIHVSAVAGLTEIIIATILATVWTLGWNMFSANKDWLVYTTFMFTFMTISAFVIARFARVDLSNVRPPVWKFLWAIAIGEVVAYLAITLGYANTTHTSIVAILSGASSLPTIILARIFLKERMTRLQTVSSLIIIIGISLLAIS